MRCNLHLKTFYLFLLVIGLHTSISAQLFYEGLVFDGMGSPLLENISAVTVSPDGNFVYTCSFDDNAITVFSRDVVASAPGELTFLEIQKNEVAGVQGLNGAFDVFVSPDGRHVYAAGSSDHTVVAFNRNTVDGTLTYLDTYWDNTDGIFGLEGAYAIDMPSDGNHVYIAAPDANAVVVFRRNVLTGELTYVQTLEDETGDVSEMNYPLALEVSPNGKFVYVTSYGDNALNVFERNLVTGELSFVEYHKEGVGSVTGLGGAYTPQLSPDGDFVYVSASESNSIVVFSCDANSGELTYMTTYADGLAGVDGISGTQSLVVSADGNYVYATGANEDAVAVFDRGSDGLLNYIGMVQEGNAGVTGISYPLGICATDDGKNIYIGGFGSATLAVFDIAMGGSMVYKEHETSGGTGVSGLDGTGSVTVSPDGNHVYVGGYNDDAMVVFSRNETSGMLDFVHKIEDGSTTDGLNGLNGIVISPDGQHAYSTGFWDKAVVSYERNEMTGELTYIERYKDGVSGVDGLNGANSVAISADGNNVYATGFWEHAVSVFSRNATTGKLTFLEVFKDGSSGVDGLNRASDVTVSPDGTTVYVAGYNDNAIAIFERNTTDGTLTYISNVKDGADDVDGINKVNSVIVSPDNGYVYATGFNDDALAIFDREADGALTYLGQMKNGVGDVTSMNGPSRLTMSQDGEHIYVTSGNDDAIIAFRRSLTDGMLVFENAQVDGMNDINGLDGAQGVAVTPDGKHMYAASSVDDAVSIFSCTYLLEMAEVVCEGDSVVVGASVYKTNGFYIDTFNFGACKSVIRLNLTVHPLYTDKAVEICSSGSYEYNGQTYTESGEYPVNMSSSIGCDSIVNLNLTVVNAFNISLAEEVCQGEMVTVGTQSYGTTGVYTNNLTNSEGCDSTVVLNLTVNPTYDMAIDAEVCDGDFYVFGTQNYIATGSYTESFTSFTGCDSIVTLNLTVLEPFYTLNESICAGDAYILGNEEYTESGVYTAMVTSTAGCESEVTLNLVVNNAANEEVNAEICQGDSYMFEGTSYNESGTYAVAYPIGNGCDSTITLNLNVLMTEVNVNATICEGETYPLGSNAYTVSGVYTEVFTTNNSCGDSTVTLYLNVEPAVADLNASICTGESYMLNGTEYTATGDYVEMVMSGAGCETEITLHLVVNDITDATMDQSVCAGESVMINGNEYTETGVYVNEMTSSGGCDSTITLNLVVYPEITTSGTVTNAIGGNNGAIDLTVTGGAMPYTYAWDNGMTTEDIANLPGGDYMVMVTDANGCMVELNFTIDFVDSTVDPNLSFTLEVYPNPALSGSAANLSLNSLNAQSLQLRLFDSLGKLLSNEALNVGVGANQHTIALPKNAGMYLIQVLDENGKSKTLNIVVQ